MKKRILFLIFIFVLLILSLPEIFYQEEKTSISIGAVHNGQLKNPALLPYSGKNFSYFSLISYYLMDNAYTHSQLKKAIIEGYKSCEKTCPETNFKIMECSDKNGGKLTFHRTHQNGMSIDFMVPKIKQNKQYKLYDQLGLLHYFLNFNQTGKLGFNPSVEIDFETMGRHLLALDDACKNNGLRIKKVILKIELKDEFFASSSGRKIKKRGIYFAKSLSDRVNRMHDDHYHVDFELIKSL